MVMRSRIRRQIGTLLNTTPHSQSAAKTLGAHSPDIPDEFNPRQYAILLLDIAASIEHALMVEYLYAAYSLGGPHVPLPRKAEVAEWREIILGIAKEEMGHMMTVQNLLRCLGGPLSLDREDYPWDSEFYPFPFRLEPLTRQSLAKYVYTESPEPNLFKGPEADEIRQLAEQNGGSHGIHRVGALYSEIEKLLENERLIPDAAFRGRTFPFQANWDEWGRGYKAGARGSSKGGEMPGTPDLLILPVTSRTQVLDALKAVATQGEATPTADDNAPSHFARFLRIFRQFPRDGTWSPARSVPVNPVLLGETATDSEASGIGGSLITHPETVKWAHLFNVRYRLLLVNLLHTFEYPSNLSEASQMSPRGLLIHATFGEMYNLHALGEILVEMPLAENSTVQMAGPPFQMPYTLRLPVDPIDRWHLHLDLLETGQLLADRLLAVSQQKHTKYLRALKEADSHLAASIQSMVGGRVRPESILHTI